MNAKLFVAIAIFITNFRACQSRKYNQFSLFNVVPIDKEHLKFLQNLETQKYLDIVFWKRPSKLYDSVQLAVSPADKEMFLERADHYKLDTEVLLDDVQRAFDNQTVRRYLRLKVETYSWEHFHTLEDIYQWLADVALKFPSIVELESIGKSAEGRDIYAIGIKKASTDNKVIVEAGIHGNEWISTAYATYLINSLLYANEIGDSLFLDVSKKYHWYVIPVLNPDGYEYTHNVDRLWRKNRRNFGNGLGVDLNRNFDYNFGKYGTSTDPRHDYYCGSAPFSEPETTALSNFVSQKKTNLKFYFSFHGYGQRIIIPYGDRIKHVDNFGDMENFGKQAIVRMYKTSGVKYAIGTYYDTLGMRLSGDSAGWVKSKYKVRYVVTFLLRDNGSYGHALPSELILPTCQETLTGMVELMTAKPRYVRSNLFNKATSYGNTVLYMYLSFAVAFK